MSIEENKAVVRKLEEALNAGRPDAGLEVWAEDLLFNGRRITPQTIAQLRAPLWDAVPDLRRGGLAGRLLVAGRVQASAGCCRPPGGAGWTMTGPATHSCTKPQQTQLLEAP